MVVSMSWCAVTISGSIATEGSHFLDDLQPRPIREHHVQDDQGRRELRGHLQRCGGAGGAHHLVLWGADLFDLLEMHLQRFEQGEVVVDDEECLHCLSLENSAYTAFLGLSSSQRSACRHGFPSSGSKRRARAPRLGRAWSRR